MMTNLEKVCWLQIEYPCTIVTDRYCGTYSGGIYVAFPLNPKDIPEEINSTDLVCASFWDNYKEPVGLGSCPESALDDLCQNIKSKCVNWKSIFSFPFYYNKDFIYDSNNVPVINLLTSDKRLIEYLNSRLNEKETEHWIDVYSNGEDIFNDGTKIAEICYPENLKDYYRPIEIEFIRESFMKFIGE